MSIKIHNKKTIELSKASFGHHGQTSIILQQIRYYFLYNGLLSDNEKQTLLKVICFNIKHLLSLNLGQPFFDYEKNTYAYHKERIFNDKECKKMFLDVLVGQTLLSMEYESLLLNGFCGTKGLIEQIIIESKMCENNIKEQIKV